VRPSGPGEGDRLGGQRARAGRRGAGRGGAGGGGGGNRVGGAAGVARGQQPERRRGGYAEQTQLPQRLAPVDHAVGVILDDFLGEVALDVIHAAMVASAIDGGILQ
jgi:hypothetical protein